MRNFVFLFVSHKNFRNKKNNKFRLTVFTVEQPWHNCTVFPHCFFYFWCLYWLGGGAIMCIKPCLPAFTIGKQCEALRTWRRGRRWRWRQRSGGEPGPGSPPPAATGGRSAPQRTCREQANNRLIHFIKRRLKMDNYIWNVYIDWWDKETFSGALCHELWAISEIP